MEPELVVGHHPALEPEAVVAELLADRAAGVPWGEMAVLVRALHAPGARAIARACARHHVPVTQAPDALAHDQRAEAVTLAGIHDAAGRQWHTVVVPGCVEGELPAPGPAPRLADVELLGTATLPSPGERRRQALAEERRLFDLACSRATARLVLTAAPGPGVLLSRFVEHLTARPARLPAIEHRPPPSLARTPGTEPVWPEGRLRLSATQLETYDDCPRRYAYEYALHLRRVAGPAADLGTVVHRVLADFLDPARPGPRTREALFALAEEHWRDDLALYRPQVEELRRDYVEMLAAWWEAEETAGGGAEVVAVERQFDVEVGDHHVVGAIDLVERTADGGLRIVDFKTGKTEPTEDEAHANLQLATYHLAATRDPDLAAQGEVKELALVFLRSSRVYEQPVTAGHAETTEERILATAGRILAEDFEPSVDAHCERCGLQRVCPLWPEGREVGVG